MRTDVACGEIVCWFPGTEAKEIGHETGGSREGHWTRRVLHIRERASRDGYASVRWCEESSRIYPGHSDKPGGLSGKNIRGLVKIPVLDASRTQRAKLTVS